MNEKAKSLLSLAECEEVIRKLHNNDSDDVVEIINYHISQFSEGYPGFLGDYYRLDVEYNHGKADNYELKEMSFFVKSLPLLNEKKREMLVKYGIFGKEKDIFKEILPKISKYASKKFTPDCYYVREDLMVLENLELTSYGILPQHIDLNINHVKMALRSLAALHASSIIYDRLELQPQKTSIGHLYKDVLFETSYMPDSQWLMTGIRSLKNVVLHNTKYGIGSSYESAIENEFMARAQKIFEILDCEMPQIPSVICHRDLWSKNLMFRFETNGDFHSPPLDCLLIDYQIARYLPLSLDVIICILLPSAELVTLADVDECTKFYYEQLSLELQRHDVKIDDILTFDDLVAGCEHFKLLPLLMQPMFFTLSNLPEAYLVNLLDTNEEKYMKISLYNRDDVVQEFIEKDEDYRRKLIKSVERLVEYMFQI